MSRSLWWVLIVVLLLITAQRAPAPIQEVQESPTPAPEQSAKPKSKPKPTIKPKPKSEPSAPATNSVRQQLSAQPSRFAGKWVGTMPEVPWGNVGTELIVDQTGTAMEWRESGKWKGRSATQLVGDTLQANFQVGVAETWSITLQSDGVTARVRLQAFMNDQTAVFHRVSAGAAQSR